MNVKRSLAVAAALALAAVTMNAGAQAGKPVDKEKPLVDPNLATREDLIQLSELTPDLADEIIKNRPYEDMVKLNKVLEAKLDQEKRDALFVRLFQPIDLNNAKREEIMLVPGAGPRMTREFLEYRPYDSMLRFRREIGKYVDEKEVARFEQYVFIQIDLNTASDEEILTIPGVGPRMLREFKEYRPYENIEKFRREIGKYVDENEVKRLERYVTIKKGDGEEQEEKEAVVAPAVQAE